MRRKKKIQFGMAGLLLVAVFVMAFAAPALAAGSASPSPALNAEKLPSLPQKVLEEARKAAPFIRWNDDGTVSFDAQGARRAGVSEDAIQQIQKDFEKVNKAIKSDESFAAITACRGENYYRATVPFVYEKVGLDYCNTNRLIYLKQQEVTYLTLASVIMGAVGAIPYAVATAVAIWIIEQEINKLQYWNSFGCGTEFTLWFGRVTSGNRQYC